MSRNLTNWLTAYNEYTQGNESPERYHLWAGLSTIAAAAQRKIRLEAGRLRIHSNLFAILVGPAGGPRKTTALDMARSLIRDSDEIDLRSYGVELFLAPEKASSAALIQRMAKIGETSKEHQSVSGYIGELGTLLGNQDSDMTDTLTAFWDCRADFEKDTIIRGGEKITAPWVNIIGATTPTWLSENLSATAMEGGFVSRGIFVYEERARGRYAIPEFTDEQRELRRPLVQDLASIANLSGTMQFTPGGQDRYVHWYEVELLEGVGSQRFAVQRQRKHAAAIKVAMLVSLAMSDSLLVDEQQMQIGIDIINDTEQDLDQAFQGVGRNIYSMDYERIKREIKRAGGAVPYKKIIHNNIHSLGKEDIDRILETLIQAGEIKRTGERSFVAA